jgi:phosphopantetheinyl transferase
MAISHEVSINQQVSYCIWKIEENEQQMLSSLQLNSVEIEDFERTKVPERRLEWLAARNALKHLLNPHGQFFLIKDHFGKPHLDATTIGVSMSHTKGYGAAALHLEGPVGIDIEHSRKQIGRIAHKFLHESEKLWCDHSTPSLTKIWSAKEALYKLHGRTQLIFAEQLLIHPFADKKGQITINDQSKIYSLKYDTHDLISVCCAY